MSLPAPVSWARVAPRSLHKTTALAGAIQPTMAATISERHRIDAVFRASAVHFPGVKLLDALLGFGDLGRGHFLRDGFPEVSALVVAMRGAEGKPLGSLHQVLGHSLAERVGDGQVILRAAIPRSAALRYHSAALT